MIAKKIEENMRRDSAVVWILVIILTFCMAACSEIGSVPRDDPGPQDNAPAIEGVELPAVWTPTMSPTPPPRTESYPVSTEYQTTPLAANHFELTVATPMPVLFTTTAWQTVDGATASFMLPTSFEVLDLGSEFGMLMAALMTGLMEGMMEVANELGEELGASSITPTPMDLGDVEAAFNIDFVLAMESDQKTSAFLFSEPLEEPSSLEEQMQAVLEDQDNPIEVVTQDRVMNASYETGRMSLLATDPDTGEQGHILIYVFLLSDRIYQLGYQTEVDRFHEALAVFETSANTFRIHR